MVVPPGTNRSATALVLAGVLSVGVSGCTSDLDQAIVEGCDGLHIMQGSYLSDRDTFDHGFDQAKSWGIASELAGDLPDEPPTVVTLGIRAFKLFSVAAYEPAEFNGGRSVWLGRPLTRQDQVQIQQAIDACEDR
jgi:hypothetical protein